MERTTRPGVDTIVWKKVGGGSFHANIGGKVMIIKPGQQFEAREDEIPMAFRDMIVPVNPTAVAKKLQEEDKKAEEAATKSTYTLKHRGGGWWDVVNADGKVQNEKALKKPDAETLLAALG